MPEEKKVVDPELQAFIEEAKRLKDAPAEAAPAAEAAPPISSLEDMTRITKPISPLETFRDRFVNKIVLGQLDKVKPAVDRFMAPMQEPGSWGEKILGSRPAPSTTQQVQDDLKRGGEQNPKTALAGDVAGSLVRSAPLMPFAGGGAVGATASTMLPNVLERGIDVERGLQTPERALGGTAVDALVGGALSKGGDVASKLLPSTALRNLPPGTTAPAANAALQPVAQAEKASVAAPLQKIADRMSFPAVGGALHAAGVPMAGPASAGYAGVQGLRSIPELLEAGRALSSNANIEGARKAIDLLVSNPTRALSLIGSGPGMIEGLLRAAGPAAVSAAGPGRKEKRREP